MKRAHDPVPDAQDVNAGTDGYHLGGPVAHRHPRPRPGEQAHQVDVVVKVEARGRDLDQHLARTRLADRPFHRF